jgi:potassium efflux system protein
LTFEALILTSFLAAPLPALLFLGSSILAGSGNASGYAATAQALSILALIALLLESIRNLFVPNGLAEAHFNWPSQITRLFYRGLLVPELISLPLLYVAIKLAMVGIRLESPERLQVYNNSLGRVAFIIAMLILGPSLLALLRPEKKKDIKQPLPQAPWSRFFAIYALPSAFLVALPLLILATLIPAVMAAFGYYLTALLLAYQMLRSLLLAFFVLVGGGLIFRWRVTTVRRSILAIGGETIEPQQVKEIEEAETQVRQLFRFVATVVLAVGLFTIWSEALPLLQIMKRVQVWPKVTVMETIDESEALPVVSAAAPTDTAAQKPADSDAGTAPAPMVPDPTAAAGDQPPTAESSQPLTLWSLLEAILAGIIAVVLARNLPGLVELFLSRRTHLDSGARVAFSTLVRYTITILGVTVVFGLLGITWSKIQWLAAALTFGLGFGLQEIVANFVSGLILLVERPVRVGDVVTIGNLMGKVTKIQIRATTITLWDRSEMIVPNKEFITTKLVNWTLSDSKRRIEIPIRIAYGADLEQVKEILVTIAKDHPSILKDPEPHALILNFGADAIQLELRFVVDFGQGITVKDQVQMSIDTAFQEAGIQFALPQSIMRVVSVDPKGDEQT